MKLHSAIIALVLASAAKCALSSKESYTSSSDDETPPLLPQTLSSFSISNIFHHPISAVKSAQSFSRNDNSDTPSDSKTIIKPSGISTSDFFPPTQKKPIEKKHIKSTELKSPPNLPRFSAKSLVQIIRDTRVVETVAYDKELVLAMRKSDAVKAAVIGMIMSSVYKQQYNKIYPAIAKSFKDPTKGPRLNMDELNAELHEHYKQFYGQLRELVKRFGGPQSNMTMTLSDIDDFCRFLEYNYLRHPHNGNFFTLANKGKYTEQIVKNEIFPNISIGVFLLKTPVFNRKLTWTCESNYHFDAQVIGSRLCLSLLTIKEVVPFIREDIADFLRHRGPKEFLEEDFILFANYLQDEDLIRIVTNVQITPFFLEKGRALLIYLGVYRSPIAVNVIKKHITSEMEEAYYSLKNKLIQAKDFFPVSLSIAPGFYYIGSAFRVASVFRFVELQDYILIFPKYRSSFDHSDLAGEAYKHGLLEFYALINKLDLLKHNQS